MFDARKRRRGELFNVSITEVILLILFLLLLLFAVFYKDLEKEYNKLKNEKKDAAELLVEIQEFRDTSGYTGPAQIKDELAELGPSYKDLKEVLYLQKEKISELEEKIEKLEAELEVLESVKDLSKIEDLEQKIDDITKFKEILKNAEPEQVEELVVAIEELLDKYGEDFDKLIEEIENLAGNALPKCWPKSYPDLSSNDGERLFTIRLQSNGIWVEPDFDERFNKEYSYLNLNEKYFRTPLPESLFLEIFSPLFELSEMENSNAISITEQRRCRHEVRIFDELSNDKEKYKRLTRAIVGYFHRFEFINDTYCDYRRKTKNDNICLNK